MSLKSIAKPERNNPVGTISLSIAAVGFGVIESAHWAWGGEGLLWSLGRAGFEAALIGGVADWFAVTALFHPVPKGPLSLPHTDIIVKNRRKLEASVVDLVENQLLSRSSVREKLQAFSMSRILLEQFESPAGRELAASTLTVLASHATAELEDVKLRDFLTDLLREFIRTVQLAPLFATWLEARLAAGDTRVLWQSLAATLADQAEQGEFDDLLRDLIQAGLDAYKAELSGPIDWVKGKAIGAFFNAESESPKLRDGLTTILREIAESDAHPLAKRLDESLAKYAANLRNGTGDAAQRVTEFQKRLADHPDLEPVVGHMMGDLRRLAEAKLRDSRAEVEAALAGAIERGVAKLRDDTDAQSRLDRWAREALEDVVTRHHGVIGETARQSLERLDDRELVIQLESRVGQDLQYIRLNGAMVGALVGIAIAGGRWLLR